MVSQKRNIMVGLFVLIGLVFIGWMLVLFRDLPARLSRYGAWEVTIHFPSASGINVNTPIYFRGYAVGRVVEIKPPALIPSIDNTEKKSYQVPVIVAVEDEYRIPRTAEVKVYTRGLGSSYLEFVFWQDPVTENYLNDGDILQGNVSQTSEFIPEATQIKLDQLFTSVTELSEQVKNFLQPVPDGSVADGSDTTTKKNPPNLRSLVNRFDETLKNINVIIGDTDNQQNVKTALVGFIEMTSELRLAIDDSRKLMANAGKTIGSIDQTAQQFSDIYGKLGEKAQNTADQLATTLKHLDQLFNQINAGQGTTGRLLNDPRLYESLADTTETLKLAIGEFRLLIAELTEHGVIGFKGK